MASGLSCTTPSSDRDINEVVELLAWYIIEEKLFDQKKGAHWYDILRVCVNSTSGNLSSRTIRLMTVVALVMKLNSDDCPNDMKKVVNHIERMLLFPEWKGLVDSLQPLSDEAKCQAILVCYANSQGEEAQALWDEYFGSIEEEEHDMRKVNSLRQLGRVRGDVSTRVITELSSIHSFATFKKEMLDFVYEALPLLEHSPLYKFFRESIASSNVTASPQTASAPRPCGVVEEKEDRQAEIMNERDASEMEEREYRDAEEAEDEQIRDSDMSPVSENESAASHERATNPTNSAVESDRDQVGEVETWSSEESSEVHTPRSRLPTSRTLTVKSKHVLIGQHKKQPARGSGKIPWDTEEVENLVKGVKKYGPGKWKEILTFYNFHSQRTNVDLKDKWRNLCGRHY